MIKKIIIGCFIISSNFFMKSQELIISNNSIIEALPGTSVILSNGMNLVNNSTSAVLNGTYIFQGTLPQKISGDHPVEFDNLNIELGAFLSLYNDVKINKVLNLSKGIINLLDKSLTMASNASLNGSFDENTMIVADGSGKFGYEISTNGTYFFPVGDTTDVDDYSPASLVFSNGTYNNATVSMNLKNKKHPNNPSTTDYLKRYWTVSQSGITNFDCDVSFSYTNNDIQGNEANIYGAKWNGSFWTTLNKSTLNSFTGNVSDFSDFTGGESSALGTEELIGENIDLISIGNKVIIRSKNNIKLKSAEVFNKLGQILYIKDLSKLNYNEINLDNINDFILIRITSDNQSFTKKIFIN